MAQATDAFMRASHKAYAATASNCQEEFRRLELKNSYSFHSSRRLVEDESVGEPSSTADRELQTSKFKRMTLRMKTTGSCNQCSKKAFIGDTADTLKINPNAITPKSRQLQQQVYNNSNCFCPLGSSVAQEPVGRTTLMRLFQEELNIIGSPIKNVNSMWAYDDSSSTRRGRRMRSLKDASSIPPPLPAAAAAAHSLHANAIPNPPSICPMVKLDFKNTPNPLAHYYGQSSMLKAGDYFHDQLWWSHGVRVAALGFTFRPNMDMFIPRFVRGTGWVDASTIAAVRLFDTRRPTVSTNPNFHQPLCVGSAPPDDEALHLGSPNKNCPVAGPGK